MLEYKEVYSCGSKWTVPNVLTMSRIVMVPVFLGAFILEAYPLALSLFVLAGITDALDGYLARTLKQRSRLGALIDPLADKLLVLTAFLCLGFQEWIALWLVVLVLLREALIVFGYMFIHLARLDLRGKITATLDSKLNTLAQILLVLSVMTSKVFDIAVINASADILIYVVAGLTLFSGMHYLILGFGLLSFFRKQEH
ncbi:CDP-alcohol phosphatidyltransferase family protein [Desulfonatronospira sp.]|uniref:CDP-alcohol phosphatidyltransferase family protein n=1 Tax=Desulfonatronospira sp. TaxID=1962951 RepID=UPI0025C48179|nr:CDP-alcohol phosphatidyltransferase family protein [Desulfonatronospira sp.]